MAVGYDRQHGRNIQRGDKGPARQGQHWWKEARGRLFGCFRVQGGVLLDEVKIGLGGSLAVVKTNFCGSLVTVFCDFDVVRLSGECEYMLVAIPCGRLQCVVWVAAWAYSR